jgi:hypothetical protein
VKLVVALAAAAAVVPPGHYVSWADETHGWALANGGPRFPNTIWCGRGKGQRELFVCATENGGKRWHPVLRIGLDGYVNTFTRTSATHGILAAANPLPYRTKVLWTPDNGRHWYPVRGVTSTIEGRGELLFMHDARATLRRVTSWPPAAAPHCERWAPEPFPRRRTSTGNVCIRAPATELRSLVVARIPSRLHLGEMRAIPEGVVSLVAPRRGAETHVFVYRLRGRYLTKLPQTDTDGRAVIDVFFGGLAWPSIDLVGSLETHNLPPWLHDDEVRWRSTDGGRTWTVRLDDGGTTERG